MLNEDTLPTQTKYAWTEHSGIDLQSFLTKFKPSMVQNDGTKPWIWVSGSAPAKEDTGVQEAIEESAEFLKEMTDKVESIKNDDSIPVRSNKKTGAKSKKELREQVQAEASEKLKEISVRHGFVSGKWLIFAPADKVDSIWSGIATSLVSGALHSTSAHLAKVSTSSESENQQQHLICVYIPDVYDIPALSQVMKILLRNHGANLSGVKSDLYTLIGLDSKHPSGIPSTVWKNSAVLPEKEIKELKDAYFTELASGSTKPAAAPVIEGTTSGTAAGGNVAPEGVKKQKPKLKKKVEDDPFASDEDEEPKNPKKAAKETPGPKKAPPKTAKKVESDADEAAKPKKASTSKSAGTRVSAKRAQKQIADEEDDEDEQPKKKRSVRK